MTLRMYQSSWIQLKSNPEKPLRIAAPKQHFPRIYKAIAKERTMDLIFRLQLSELNKTARLSRKVRNGILFIYLNLSIGSDDF